MRWRERFRWAVAAGVRAGLLTPRDVVVLFELVDRAGPSGQPIHGATKQVIGSAMDVGERTIALSVARLKEGGWLDWHHNQDRTPQGNVRPVANTYLLLIPTLIVAQIEQQITATKNPNSTAKRGLPAAQLRRMHAAVFGDVRAPVGPAYEIFKADGDEPGSSELAAQQLAGMREALSRNKAPP